MATRAGFHAHANFEAYPRSLSAAIRCIGRNFYVTKSFQSESVGNSSYWGLLARPADDFSVHLNADRELLFVFSDYKNFEVRTLEAFDAFYNTLEQKRVDKSIRFLISADPKIESIIRHYLSQNPEYPIIIPIHLPTMTEAGSHILDAIRRNYLLRDLFGYQNPLREETFFFGRQNQVNSVLDLTKSGQSSSIFGLRKSGKTSAIYAIIRRAKSFGITPVFIDCQSPAIHARSYGDLLTHILGEIRKALGFSKLSATTPASDVEVAEYFKNQLTNTLNQSKTRVLIIFDEIENITPNTAASPHWAGRDCLLFWQNVRSFIQQDPAGRLAVCIVGTSPLILELPRIAGVANPMYLFSQKQFIPNFTFEETCAMINRLGFFMGLEFDSSDIATLHKVYGGHPFFVRQACSIIHKNASTNRPLRVGDRMIQNAIQEFGGQLDTYISDILKGLKSAYPGEFDLLSAVANGDASEVIEYAEQAQDLIDHLTGYELIEKTGEGFEIKSQAIRNALARATSPATKEDFWTEIMVRRNRVEGDIRRELFSYSKNLSPEQWSLLLEGSLSNSRYQNLPSIEPAVLFSKTNSPLYLTDLLMILKQPEVLPYLQNRRSAVLDALHTLNKCRKDAHANEVSAEEMSVARVALTTLENEFQQPA